MGPMPNQTQLWKRLAAGNAELANCIERMRSLCGRLGGNVAKNLPGFTDHSVKHMDALWGIADMVITENESDRISPEEAFILGASFYVHDMALALVNSESEAERLRKTPEYERHLARLVTAEGSKSGDRIALAWAARELHHLSAAEYVDKPLPGVGAYLIENADLRSQWGELIADVSRSHGEDLVALHSRLGSRKPVRLPNGQQVNPAWLGCMLRIIDFAHTNSDRADWLLKSTRGEIDAESLLHWWAQEHIIGPVRERDHLSYTACRKLESIKPWWLLYDMMRELHAEIGRVRDYLDSRSDATDRFSLVGLRGIHGPEAFSEYVPLSSGVLPVDIAVRPASMERVVKMLAGSALYGHDVIAPLRELLQNSSDAIRLRRAENEAAGRAPHVGQIKVIVRDEGADQWLEIEDDGVGMTPIVMKRYLLAVGASFWESVDYRRDFGQAAARNFSAIGRYGVGFLSVFMIASVVEVLSEGIDGSRHQLSVGTIGQRGEMKSLPPTGYRGTKVRLKLKSRQFNSLEEVVSATRGKVPMLDIPLVVSYFTSDQPNTTSLRPGWWQDCSTSDLRQFLNGWASGNSNDESFRMQAARSERVLSDWPGERPDVKTPDARLVGLGGAGVILVCNKGVAVETRRVQGLCGMVNYSNATPNVARSALIDSGPETSDPWSASACRELLRPSVVSHLDGIGKHGMMLSRLSFLRELSQQFGMAILRDSMAPWFPLLEPPGNVTLCNWQTAVQRIRSFNRIMMGSNVPAHAAYAVAAGILGAADAGQLPIVPIHLKEIEVDYKRRQKLEVERGKSISDPLNSLLTLLGVDEEKLVLFTAVLSLVSEAWDCSVSELRTQKWTYDDLDYETQRVYSILQRPSQNSTDVSSESGTSAA